VLLDPRSGAPLRHGLWADDELVEEHALEVGGGT
jgi:hypothetical protein